MPISYSLELPTQRVDAGAEFVSASAISDVARAAEEAGFAAVHVTDHPAPDAKWLDHGGHHALDPFVALSFAAAATSTVKVLTNVYIAAYRNPFLGAKSIQSLAVLSGNRLIVGAAAGYLKPEFRAWESTSTRAARFSTKLSTCCRKSSPAPTSLCGQLVLGQGRAAASATGDRTADLDRREQQARRTPGVTHAQGWAPFNTFGYAAASRTAEISTLDELESAITWPAPMPPRSAGRNRWTSASRRQPARRRSVDRRTARDRRPAGRCRGVTWLTIAPAGHDRAEYVELAAAFAKEFITT